MTIQEAAHALRAGKVSSVELTTDAFARIGKLNSKLNAFLTVLEETALDSARQADQELRKKVDLGPLHGIPVAVKDVFETDGVRTTCGSKLFTNFVPDRDAAVVEKLEAAGAVLIGKTGMHELAYGVTSNNPHFGPVRNPWNPDCIPGGSSGGSGAAVAAGMAFMAMGSDTGGSIRIPAAYCGTVGLKPTFGRVSRYGVMPLDFSLDHMGPLTRSVRDAALTLDVLAGFDPRDETSSRRPVDSYTPPRDSRIPGLRIGWPENFFFDCVDPAVRTGLEKIANAAASCGAVITPVRVPDIAAINAVSRVILMVEASALMEPFLHRREDFGADVLALLDQGRLLSGADYVNAQRLRKMMQREFRSVWENVDCLLTPTAPIGAPKIGQMSVTVGSEPEDVRLATTRLVRSLNLLGLPALAMPCGLNTAGLPISAQIVGKPFDEATILRVAAAIEDVTDFHSLQPPTL
ncbi:MAG TPA: amidase [Bryobacteraceae bacterium]|nr:amidase [Bryobacteraceae bacterium]